jgi:hypothetical protein
VQSRFHARPRVPPAGWMRYCNRDPTPHREHQPGTQRLIAMNTLSVFRSTALGFMLILLVAACTPQAQGPALAATINRDCGPADGPAFTLTVPWEGQDQISISIWQSAEITGRARFNLKDPTDQTGSATLFRGPDVLEPLSGTVVFDGVSTTRPVEGEFTLTSASGKEFEARFVAEWIELAVYCG